MIPDRHASPLDASAKSPRYESIEQTARYYATLGGWITAQAVMDYCQITVDALQEWRKTNHVPGAEFNDRNFYYPAAHSERDVLYQGYQTCSPCCHAGTEPTQPGSPSSQARHTSAKKWALGSPT